MGGGGSGRVGVGKGWDDCLGLGVGWDAGQIGVKKREFFGAGLKLVRVFLLVPSRECAGMTPKRNYPYALLLVCFMHEHSQHVESESHSLPTAPARQCMVARIGLKPFVGCQHDVSLDVDWCHTPVQMIMGC